MAISLSMMVSSRSCDGVLREGRWVTSALIYGLVHGKMIDMKLNEKFIRLMQRKELRILTLSSRSCDSRAPLD